ncbi:MAG: glycosyltransferase [Myxococcales bacterium]
MCKSDNAPSLRTGEKWPTFTMVLGANIWSPHMAPLAYQLASILGVHFETVVFAKTDQERRDLGWGEPSRPLWLQGPPRRKADERDLIRRVERADVALLGSVPTSVLERRAKTGRLTLVMAERILKKPAPRLPLLAPRYAHAIGRYRRIVNREGWHSLAIGHYAERDLRELEMFGDNIWRWGYFVEVNREPPRNRAPGPLRCLWVGRLLDWKRVDTLIRAVERVQHEPWFGDCLIVGAGPEEESLRSLARARGIAESKLGFSAPLPMPKVRELMRARDLLVVSSGRGEGWGAVVGEAMSEGCLVVANEQAGASRNLITPNKTGFLFEDGSVDSLEGCLRRAAIAGQVNARIRQNAWKKISDEWSPRVGAERVVQLAADLLAAGNSSRFGAGPCSRCESFAEVKVKRISSFSKVSRAISRRASNGAKAFRNALALNDLANMSYSQYGEDMVLRAIFHRFPPNYRGFYVDIGANHPTRRSNSFHFYERGWRGICIDPIPLGAERFRKARPRDAFLPVGVAEKNRQMTYYMFKEPCFNTFSEEQARSYDFRWEQEASVSVRPLRDLLEENLPRGQVIDFLTIDAEGMDLVVARSNDWTKFRPRAVVAESAGTGDVKKAVATPLSRYMGNRGYVVSACTPGAIYFLDTNAAGYDGGQYLNHGGKVAE